jgi:hypothetical protein
MIGRCAAAWVVLVIVLPPWPGLAEATRAEVEALFAASPKVAASSLAAARTAYGKIDDPGPLANFAFALVLIEQQQWQEASQLLTTLTRTSPKAIAPRRTLIWVQLARKDYQTALGGLESLVSAIPAAKDARLTTDQRQAAAFAGSAIAFLEGPASAARLDRLVSAATDRILEKLNPELRSDFDEGRIATRDQFQKLQTDTATAKDEVAAQQADAVASEKERLNEAQSAVDDAQSELETRADRRKQQTQSEVDALNEQFDELRGDQSRVLAAGAPLQMQIQSAQAEITGLTQVVDQPDGSTTIEYLDPGRVRYLEQVIGSLQVRLAPLQAELNGINMRIEGLRNKHGAVLRQHNIDLRQMSGEGQQLAKSRSRLDRMEKNNARAKITGNSTRTRVLSARTTTFSTYEPFPMASEKQRVLDLLR